jgi:hypothetical protein
MEKKRYIGFSIAGILFLIAAVAALAWQIVGLVNFDYDKAKFEAPGSEEISISEPGRYVVFYEYRSELYGKEYNTKSEDISDLIIDISEVRSGREVDWFVDNARTNYDLRNAGVSMMKFDISEPTTVLVESYYKDGEGPQIVLVVAKNFVWTIIRRVFAMIISTFLLGTIGVVLFVLPFIIRAASKRKASAGNTEAGI